MSRDETEPGELDSHHGRRPTFINAFNVGQVAQIVSLILSIGGVVLYQRGETEAIRSAALVQAEKLSTVSREAIEQKQELKQSLTEIKGDVKAVSAAVQTLSLQVQLSQQRTNGAKP